MANVKNINPTESSVYLYSFGGANGKTDTCALYDAEAKDGEVCALVFIGEEFAGRVITVKDSFNMGEAPGEVIGELNIGESPSEREAAEWLALNFGGKIGHVREVWNNKTPDYIWEGEKWELKEAGSAKGVENRLHKAKPQVGSGGVLLDISNSDGSLLNMVSRTALEMVSQGIKIVIIRKNGELIDILEQNK
jgi:hypothetical protein